MAPVALSFVVRFSSQDQSHKAENLLKNTGCWLSDKADKSGQIEAEFQPEKSSYINFVDIGNHGSAFVEILVGRSMWAPGQDYHTLVPSAVLMSPTDCKHWNNINTVKMFNDASLSKSALNEQWDRIRVVCRQPFNKEKPFGLAFIKLRAPEGPYISSPSPSGKSSVNARDDELGDGIFKLKQASGLNGCIRGMKKSPESQLIDMSRSARMVQAAINNRKSLSLSPSLCNSTSSSPESPSDKANRKRAIWQSEEDSIFETKRSKDFSQKKFSITGDIEEETKCFLDGIQLTKIDLDTVTFADLRDQMEKQRRCPLTKLEKKIFMKLTKEAVAEVMDIAQKLSSSKCKNPSPTTPKRRYSKPKKNLVQNATQKEGVKATNGQQGKSPNTDSPCYERSRNRIRAVSLDLSFTPPRQDSSDDELFSVSHLPGKASKQKDSTCTSKPPTSSIKLSPSSVGTCDSPVQPRTPVMDPSPVICKSSLSEPVESSLVECPICASFYPQSAIAEHAAGCVSFAVDSGVNQSENAASGLVSCPICNKGFTAEDIEAHASFCVDRDAYETVDNHRSEIVEIY